MSAAQTGSEIPAQREFPGFAFETTATGELTERQRSQILELFDAAYRQANHAYAERSLQKLRHVSFAVHEGKTAGFAVADARTMDLPRLPRQSVVLAGLSCIRPEYRRMGLFIELERRAMLAGDALRGPRFLMSGRMAHPAAFRSMSRNPTVVPKPGVATTAWQREVGQALADAFGVGSFDQETFVCQGSGTPIGYPVIDIEVQPEEWAVFEPVNRDRGDSLLGVAWMPDAPEGW